jgi:predicted exporter
MTCQKYKEDISDFLPLDNGQQQAFQKYQNSTSARRIYVIFNTAAESDLSPLKTQAADYFCDLLDRSDNAGRVEYRTADDPEVMEEAMGEMYARMPYLLTAEDYDRIDSLTADGNFIVRQLENDKQMLMLPTAGMMALQIQHDPLQLFTPVVERLRSAWDTHRTMLLIDSPFGASETEHNAQLIDMLQQVSDSVTQKYPEVTVRLTGGPVIAVGNARQIKTDSITAVTLAVAVILLLLWLAFRNIRNLLLIAVSIGWGWLFAMGCLTMVHRGVSIIVIGISSVIVGIAVNYPLHLIAHLPHTHDIRSALKEMVMPLVVGNITTVGAFLALVPLNSVALRDLGLFSAFLLVGTILFVLLWLPHLVKRTPQTTQNFIGKMGNVQLENKQWVVWTVAVLTIVLGYFSLQTSFDADLRNINYMTDKQKQDMKYLEQFNSFKSQTADLTTWNEWRSQKGNLLCQRLKSAAEQTGFAEHSFDNFYRLVATEPQDQEQSITTDIVNNLSDNFNYIGWACAIIVFVFLWFSLGSIELALLSFLPMAVSWIWILGLMAMLGIKFNVENIILATFIFGQGDDYTIFMTEGCQYEYAYRRKMLSSYKYGIIVSALIMFVGIGALIFAKHPALFSLAEVTVIGMFSVVLMAFLLPPLIFRWMVYNQGKERLRPITLKQWLTGKNNDTAAFVADCYRYRGIEISTAVNRRLRKFAGTPSSLLATHNSQLVIFVNSGWGEVALYHALQNPNLSFIGIENDKDKASVAKNVADGRAANIAFLEKLDVGMTAGSEVLTILLEPSEKDIEKYSVLNPIIKL